VVPGGGYLRLSVVFPRTQPVSGFDAEGKKEKCIVAFPERIGFLWKGLTWASAI